jgi:hypothetical protein
MFHLKSAAASRSWPSLSSQLGVNCYVLKSDGPSCRPYATSLTCFALRCHCNSGRLTASCATSPIKRSLSLKRLHSLVSASSQPYNRTKRR